MSKSIIISERDNIAAVQKDNKVVEFFIHRGDMLLGDVYLSSVENILPSIDAAFVNLGGERMGFLHASDVIGKGSLKEKLQPKQKVLVQIMKEPTGNKGPRVTTQISLPGRFLVLMPDEKGVNVSRKILSSKERGRLKSIVSLLKPAGVGVIIRTEAEDQAEQEIQDDLEFLMEKWSNIVTAADTVEPPNLLYRDQDLLYRVIREACTEDVKEIIVDTPFALHRTNQLLQSWNMGNGINVNVHKGNDSILIAKGIDKEIRTALQTKVNLPCGGYLFIQTTEALTVVDVNSGKFTSSATQNETIRKTNLEAVAEIARQLKLRNIGGMIIIDFIDMENRVDKLAILEELEQALESDKGKPQVGQLSDLGLVELTRHRQGQSLAEIFTKKCPACNGLGAVVEELNFVVMPVDADFRANKNQQRIRMPQRVNPQQAQAQTIQQGQQGQQVNKQQRPQRIQQDAVVEKTQEVQESVEKNQRFNERVIKTKPTTNVADQENKRQPQPEIKYYQLNENDIKKYMSKDSILLNYSKHVKFAIVPPGLARKHLNSNYIVDVFTILRELESVESSPETKQIEEPLNQRRLFNTPAQKRQHGLNTRLPFNQRLPHVRSEETQLGREQTQEATEETQVVTEQTQESAEVTQVVREQSQQATEEIQVVREQSQQATEETQVVREESQETTEETQAVREQPQETTEDTQVAREQSQEATEEIQAVREQPQETTEETQVETAIPAKPSRGRKPAAKRTSATTARRGRPKAKTEENI